ncbi:MAG: translation initiation factor eIF-2B [Dehalococcoidales bacterium]|nr:translation initiation factor eIF-2B [Dehalococcoidales bacterium]
MTVHPEVLRLVDQIREDTTHGASELARQALGAFILLSDVSREKSDSGFRQEFYELAEALKYTRPSMASLNNAVNRLLKELPHEPAEMTLLRTMVKRRAEELILLSQQANAVIAAGAAEMCTDGETVMTHSYSSTVSAAIIAAHKKHGIKAIVTRSGAGRTGIRTAKELDESGIELVFIDDTAAGLYITGAGRVFVGADKVCNDGALVNGAGTYLMALAAEKAGVPLFVLCDTLKFDPSMPGSGAELEEKDPSEVIAPGVLNPRIQVKNPYFDVTPPYLITGFITEAGLIERHDLADFFTRNV